MRWLSAPFLGRHHRPIEVVIGLGVEVIDLPGAPWKRTLRAVQIEIALGVLHHFASALLERPNLLRDHAQLRVRGGADHGVGVLNLGGNVN